MRKSMPPLIGLIAVVLLAGAFYAGYLAGGGGRGTAGGQGEPTIYSQWIRAEKPPMPKIAIDGVDIPVKLAGYSWCQPASGKSMSCVSTDAAIPTVEPIPVKGGSEIKTTAPKRIKEFSLMNTSKDFDGDDYFVPTAKGEYQYHIHCEWFLDQGQADYYFAVKVE
ncbi:hypothetical protein [Paenibacillus silvisoli]|uniref:hypothetical protein n=1 Tax=Paenibacillus silvisoli TaxID=3110539 RepID=UPI0028043E39|nr:hypothetical protein [Paenibacillus silvisoli]